MRKRWIYKDGEAFEITQESVRPQSPMIFGDLPGYLSPATGLWVEGRRARREDFKQSNTRPWEGLEQEKKESQRQNMYNEQRLDASLTKTASEAFYQLPSSKRAILRGIK